MITIKTDKEITLLREGGKILKRIMDRLAKEVKPGVTTGYLERLANELIKEAGGRPSFKGYKSRHDVKPFPTALCASVNDEIVHAPALPSRRLKKGDIIGLDLGMEYPLGRPGGGLYTDMAVTVGAGKIDPAVAKLLAATAKALKRAIKAVRPGKTLNDIGRAVEEYAEKQGFSVVRDLVGHGVGYDVHEDPNVPNYVIKDKYYDNVVLRPGMVIAIEPMINLGQAAVTGSSDGFTIKTTDGSPSAHFEHTVAITEKGCLVITA